MLWIRLIDNDKINKGLSNFIFSEMNEELYTLLIDQFNSSISSTFDCNRSKKRKAQSV